MNETASNGAGALYAGTCFFEKVGVLVILRPGMMVKAFDDVVFKKALLQVHGPVKTRFSFHLIQTIYRQ